jgi:hypothetical protein
VTRRWRIRAYGACVGLLVIGAACALLVDGLTGQVLLIAFEMAGFGGALLVAFFEVGVSEDQEREREERRQRRRP